MSALSKMAVPQPSTLTHSSTVRRRVEGRFQKGSDEDNSSIMVRSSIVDVAEVTVLLSSHTAELCRTDPLVPSRRPAWTVP
jgi:hypothetical protein